MPIRFFGDSDDSEKENPPQKKARGPTTNGTVAPLTVAPPPPLPLTPQWDSGKPAGEQTPSRSQGHRPTGRVAPPLPLTPSPPQLDSARPACCDAQPHMMILIQNMKNQLITRVNYLAVSNRQLIKKLK
ncbi:hypothetical protein VZT92_017617 [Zoarces viviparus]|uniref:Uncharacterized protein n=1 Tax=Zoarces viviparus TaxID=48416 RepID=A0AAW1ELZ2_ZOAVI